MNELNDQQKHFIELAKAAEEIALQRKNIQLELDAAMRELPVGEMFQDPESGIVYQIIIPSGTFIEYRNIGYIRTRKDGETKGTLSKSAAEEAGFTLAEVKK